MLKWDLKTVGCKKNDSKNHFFVALYYFPVWRLSAIEYIDEKADFLYGYKENSLEMPYLIKGSLIEFSFSE